MISRTIAEETMHVRQPIFIDATYIYKTRYEVVIETGEDGLVIRREYNSYYGGMDGTWHQFVPLEELDMTVSGVLVFTGAEWNQVRKQTKAMELHDLQVMASLRDDLEEVIERASRRD